MNWLMFMWLRFFWGDALFRAAMLLQCRSGENKHGLSTCFILRDELHRQRFSRVAVDIIHERYYRIAQSLGFVAWDAGKHKYFLHLDNCNRDELKDRRNTLIQYFVDECCG